MQSATWEGSNAPQLAGPGRLRTCRSYTQRQDDAGTLVMLQAVSTKPKT